MASPIRFVNGVSSVASTDPLAAIPYLDPTTWAIWQENFIITPNTSLGWTLTTAGTTPTVAQAGVGPCGGIVLTLAGADNDVAQLYPTLGQFTLESGKKALFEVKCRVNKATGTIGLQELFLGLSKVQTTTDFVAAAGATLAVDNAVGFWSGPADANINCVVRVADVESIQTAATTYADVTDMVLTWYFDGTSVYFYKDDVLIATIVGFPTAVMTPMLFIKAAEAKAAVLTAYYMLVARER